MQTTTQRRWLVKNPKRLVRRPELKAARKDAQELRDWFDLNPENPFNSTRLRLTDKTKLTLTVKTGPGRNGRRESVTSNITDNTEALIKIKRAPKTVKRRYAFKAPKRLGGGLITVDVYSRPGKIAIVEWNDPPEGRHRQGPARLDGLVRIDRCDERAHERAHRQPALVRRQG